MWEPPTGDADGRAGPNHSALNGSVNQVSHRVARVDSTRGSGFTTCTRCRRRARCLPRALPRPALVRFSTLLHPHPTLARGEILYRAGDPSESVFVVRTGVMKSCAPGDDGPGSATCFHLPGELVGADSIHGTHYASTTVALRKTNVCRFRFKELEDLAGDLSVLQQRLFRVISREIACGRDRLRMLGLTSPTARVARLLLLLEQRIHGPGRPGEGFILAMSRTDMADYLVVSDAEVQEALTHFQNQGWISLRGAQIRIVAYPPLRKSAEGN